MADVTIAGGSTNLPVANSIDGVNDYLPIYTASSLATQAISRNTLLGLASAPVGLTDSQTLTNKALTSPTISGPTLSGTLTGTYTIGGTPTFPSSVATLTGSQTLTNKTLTSPTINSPTIANATITADTLAGYSASTTGTVYGMSVTTGLLASAAIAGQVNTAAVGTNAITAAKLATDAITLGYAQITTNFVLSASQTTPTQITGLTATVTIPAGGRKIKITAYISAVQIASSGDFYDVSLWDGTVNSGTELQKAVGIINANGGDAPVTIIAVVTPVAGSKTYNVGINNDSGARNVTAIAASTNPAFILVEAI